jgi:ribosomal protein L25 (general stress protein Ctc)
MYGDFDSDIRISLDLNQFKALVSGNIVMIEIGSKTIQITLQDIGYDQMTKAIANHIVKL